MRHLCANGVDDLARRDEAAWGERHSGWTRRWNGRPVAARAAATPVVRPEGTASPGGAADASLS
jgi:hypothetical protein